jgi:hypothetical protein
MRLLDPSASRRPLRAVRIADLAGLPPVPSERWLVEDLWIERAAAVLGGPPKSGKTWLAVDLALSVASGTAVLDRYSVRRPGPVLFFAAEDSPEHFKERFSGLAARRAVRLGSLDVFFLDVPRLRLEEEEDQERLLSTVTAIRPRLLVIDPFVRAHGVDENSASEVSRLLAFLRSLERDRELAILIIHHTRKAGASSTHPGQGLRGSSDIQAWADMLFYLDRAPEGLRLVMESRSTPPPAPITLKLLAEPAPHLEIVAAPERAPGEGSFAEEVLWCLRTAEGPLRLEEIRAKLATRKQRVVDALRDLATTGKVRYGAEGYSAQPEGPSLTPRP